jgi:hypothetical protein
MLTIMTRGQCLCGAVQIEISGPLSAPSLCHCGQCRRLHGAPGAYTSAPISSYRLTGEENLNWYRSSPKAEQAFCRKCGSKLFWREVGGESLDVCMGSLETPTRMTLGRHIWTSFQGDYYEIGDDGVPHYAESSTGQQPVPSEKISPGAQAQPAVHLGGCECGAVKYRVKGRMRDVLVCHCSQCRHFHGHAPGYSATRRAELEIEGEGNLAWYAATDEAKRGYCGHCGSSLFWAPTGRNIVCVTAGTLRAPTGLKTIRHIFVDDKSDYYQIADGIPQFPGSVNLDPVAF